MLVLLGKVFATICHLTFPAPITFSAAYTESPHLEHFSAPPNFWANFEVFGLVVGR